MLFHNTYILFCSTLAVYLKELQRSSCLRKFYEEAAMENLPVFQGQRLCEGALLQDLHMWKILPQDF